MRVSMNKVTLLSAAVAALFASAAQAQLLTLTVAGSTTTTNIYASEVKTPAVLTNAAALVNTTVLGFGVASLNDRYIRYDITNATFGTAVTAGMLVLVSAVAPTPFLNTAVVQGGAVGENYVVFQVTGNTSGHAATDPLTFTYPAASILNIAAAADVRLSYSLHETAVSANGAVPSNVTRLHTTSGVVVKFTPSITITTTPVGTGVTETIAATQNFQQFCSGATLGTPGTAGCASTSTDLRAVIGNIATYALVAAPGKHITTGVPVTFADVVGVTSAVTISGGLSNAASIVPNISVTTVAVCAPTGTAGVTTGLTATSARFVVAATPLAVGSMNTLCAVVNGTSSINEQSFTGSYKREAAAAPYDTTGLIDLGTTGQWVRDGAEFQSPWFSFGGTRYISRFFFMNTGSTAATCTATILTEAGNTVTAGSLAAGFSVPANGQLAVLATDIAASATVAGRAAVRFACLAPTTNMQGRYVITDTVSGALDSGQLLRPGTN